MSSQSPEAEGAPRLEVLDDAGALARRVAQWLLDEARAATGSFALALSGGTTPRRLYEALAAPPCREAFPWARCHVFWGDERCVPPDDAASNFRMAREALLARVPIPDANIHPIPAGRLAPEAAAAAYEEELRAFLAATARTVLFDVVLLGLGEDGHTASLFPGSPLLQESGRWVAVAGGAEGRPPVPRVTLTLPALQNARAAAFIVSGVGKRGALERLLRGDAEMPAARLRPRGKLLYFTDRAAAPAGAA
ncbi:MAG TPA: 6-phosphogluconolactonase [Candidatus Desulfobacillus sp.]|nr:6-phosphogluconolactonase [Candidatus Desulfobacillus sp.]